MNHYKYFEAHLPAFFKALGIPGSDHLGGLIVAHGDKFYGYRRAFEQAGLAFPHGAAIAMLSYLNPYAQEVGKTPGGWVHVEQWVVANKDRFLPHLPPLPGMATNQEIDEYVARQICEAKSGVRSLTLAGGLEREFDDRLPKAGKNALSGFHNAGEHANRACQRLRRAGIIVLGEKASWFPAPLRRKD
jgi:hypothetical protein